MKLRNEMKEVNTKNKNKNIEIRSKKIKQNNETNN